MTNSFGANVSVIDTASNTVTATVTGTGGEPWDIAIAPQGPALVGRFGPS